MSAECIVMFSGGKGSWAAGKRAVERFGQENTVLLFADTLVEDPETYVFLKQAAENIGSPLVRIADGRTPFEVFRDDRFLGNSRLANCSKYLKIIPCKKWLAENVSADATVVVGIDWMEIHRLAAIEHGYAPHPVWAPMTDKPYMAGHQIIEWLHQEGLQLPKAYTEGFPHNNCMQQGCVRGGQAYWNHLLRARPDVYRRTEEQEQRLREHLGSDVAMLRDRTGGELTPLTLAQFRERLERQPSLFDADEWGACGCFIADPATQKGGAA